MSKEGGRMNTHNEFIRQNFKKMSNGQLAKATGLTINAVEHRLRRMDLRRGSNKVETVSDSIVADIEKSHRSAEKKSLDKKYKTLLAQVGRVEAERDAVVELKATLQSHKITATPGSSGEATAVVVASDWHVEETVRPESVNGKNEYNLHIAKQRADEFFVNAVKLLKKEQQAITIKKMVLALLGDFISGNIHEELLSNCSLAPVKAMIFAQNCIYSGINYILENTDVDLVIPCHVGNHPRITHKVNISNEQGNSLEYYMYHVLSNAFAHEKRVTFIIAESYHTYLDIYGKVLRFHHGHAIKYGGGIGGLTICTNKAIAQWNKTLWADIDVFGHLHQSFDGGNFIANGSNIGYNTFAITIKGSYEPPRQQFFLIDSKRGKTVVAPIVYSI